MKLAVGFITYNETSAKYLADFLPSLFKALELLPPPDYEILVWDNSETENKTNRLALEAFNQAQVASNAKLIKYATRGLNLGFARAYNLLMTQAQAAGAEYFLIINPDTLLEPNAISELVRALDQSPTLASVSPKILRWDFAARQKTKIIDSCGLILKSGLRFKDLGQGEVDHGQFDKSPILGPSGAAGLFRLSALGPAPYFDESFFMYKEDCDLAYRLSLAGQTARLVPSATIYHDRTAAASREGLWRDLRRRGQKSRLIRAWSFRNQHFIFIKYWKKQNFVNKLEIVFRALSMLIFSLILEQFILKQYTYILNPKKVLTNVK